MIVATLASLKGREALLARTIESLVPQVDAICVYLNGHDVVPDCLKHPKVLHAILSSEAGWRGAEAKFWFWNSHDFRAAPAWREDDVALIVDDDIVYPPDYAARMVAALDARPGTVACVHGSILARPFVRYADSRMVAGASAMLAEDARVHIPGTGTLAFRRRDVDFAESDVTWSHCVDVCFALWARARGVECWAVARDSNWLQPLPVVKGTRIFDQRVGARNEGVETAMIKAVEWPRIPALAIGFKFRASESSAPSPSVSAALPREAVEWFLARAPRVGTVVELGSGYGTAAILSGLPTETSMISVEHDERFVGLVEGHAYAYAPIRDRWYGADALRASLPAPAAISAVIVDGPPASIGRAGLLEHLEMFGDAPMLLDDAHRPDDLAVAEEIARRRGLPLVVHPCANGRAFATVGWPSEAVSAPESVVETVPEPDPFAFDLSEPAEPAPVALDVPTVPRVPRERRARRVKDPTE